MNSAQKLARVSTFVAQNDLELQHACLLLGGAAALGRLQRFRRRLALADKLATTHRRDLIWLQGLFGLENVHEAESDEAICFAELSLDDPTIFSVCMITDALNALIDELDHRSSASDDSVSVAA